MKLSYLFAASVLLAGCGTSSPDENGDASASWYTVGYDDASSGKTVRDNNTLMEWFGDPEVDRASYLTGYTTGQKIFCRPATLKNLGLTGQNFPASCDSAPDADSLKQVWQSESDRFNQR